MKYVFYIPAALALTSVAFAKSSASDSMMLSEKMLLLQSPTNQSSANPPPKTVTFTFDIPKTNRAIQDSNPPQFAVLLAKGEIQGTIKFSKAQSTTTTFPLTPANSKMLYDNRMQISVSSSTFPDDFLKDPTTYKASITAFIVAQSEDGAGNGKTMLPRPYNFQVTDFDLSHAVATTGDTAQANTSIGVGMIQAISGGVKGFNPSLFARFPIRDDVYSDFRRAFNLPSAKKLGLQGDLINVALYISGSVISTTVTSTDSLTGAGICLDSYLFKGVRFTFGPYMTFPQDSKGKSRGGITTLIFGFSLQIGG